MPLFNRQNTGERPGAEKCGMKMPREVAISSPGSNWEAMVVAVKLSSNVVKQWSNDRKDGGRIGEFARRTLAENSRPTAAGEFARFASR